MKPALTRTSCRDQPFCDTTVGNYQLLRHLGSGSFAQVYLAKHLSLQSLTALKLLTLPSISPDEWQHFQFEARVLAHLRHPHIVPTLDFGWARGQPYLVMEYAPGGTLQQVFPLGKALPISSILPTVLQLANALQFIHNHGVIHCDVKPANVLLGPGNVVWLSDFGIATTLTSASTVLYGRESVPGTPSYISP